MRWFCYNRLVETLILIFIFIFGTIIGSFLNVVICRHNTGRGLGGRSICAVTGKTLRWYELIPVVSFLIQGGRSRYSKSNISWQYPLVETGTGFVFMFIGAKFLPLTVPVFAANFIFWAAVFSFLILIFVYDAYHQMIPDAFLRPLIALGVAGLFWHRPLFDCLMLPNVWMVLAGPLVALPAFIIWRITRGRGMGFGDVLLLVPLGWLAGLSQGFAGLLFAFWIGAAYGVILLALHKKHLKSAIPFGPFLIIGFAIAFFYNVDMMSIAEFFGKLM